MGHKGWVLLLFIVCLLLGSCRARYVVHDGEPLRDTASTAAAAGSLMLPPFPRNDAKVADLSAARITSGLASFDFEGMEYAEGAGIIEHPQGWGACLLTAEPGGIAWARYTKALPDEESPDYDRFYGVNIDVDDEELEDEDWLPAHPYWSGVANYERGAWDFEGPFTDFMAQVETGHHAARDVYVSPAGNVNIVVVSYCPRGAEPEGLSVMVLGCEATDVEPGQEPF